MLPEGARRAPNEGLEASGAPLGAMWARSGRQGGAQLRGALGGSWGLLGALLAPLGPLLALPGGSRRVPGSLREVIFGAFFGGRRRDPEISCFCHPAPKPWNRGPIVRKTP